MAKSWQPPMAMFKLTKSTFKCWLVE